MQIAIISNGSVAQVGDYRELFPNTSFPPGGPNDSFLSENSAMRVNLFKAHDRATQKLVAAEPHIEDGWVYTVQVAPKSEEELVADASSKAAEARAQRNRLLVGCDWTQLDDADLDNETKMKWRTYRQALRDISQQPGFPTTIEWPHDPNWVEPITPAE